MTKFCKSLVLQKSVNDASEFLPLAQQSWTLSRHVPGIAQRSWGCPGVPGGALGPWGCSGVPGSALGPWGCPGLGTRSTWGRGGCPCQGRGEAGGALRSNPKCSIINHSEHPSLFSFHALWFKPCNCQVCLLQQASCVCSLKMDCARFLWNKTAKMNASWLTWSRVTRWLHFLPFLCQLTIF